MSDNKHIQFVDNLQETEVSLDNNALENAKATLENGQLPTTRNEAWKYTRVAKINKVDFETKEEQIDNLKPYVIDDKSTKLVFINGYFSEEHSDAVKSEGININVLSSSSGTVNTGLEQEDEIFNAVNTLFLNDGVEITFAKNKKFDERLEIIHILKGDKVLSNFKTIINIDDFSEANLIQGFYAEGDCDDSFANVTTEVTLGINSNLTIDKLQYESEATYHINSELVQQEKDSTFTINTITLNGMLVRNNLNIEVNGENCTTNLNGAYILKNKQHIDNHTVVDHKVSHCDSNELYKGVIDDNSTAVFNGKVYVRENAQKINAFQSNGNVLLSDNATINSKPELEIYADDVKCSHGSTTGQLDEDAVFYLRARGLSEKSARRLLVSAFIQEVLENIENEAFLESIENILEERFNWVK
jgi:Fe-S cluster assembly protein SufD